MHTSSSSVGAASPSSRLNQLILSYWELCKPRLVGLALFAVGIGYGLSDSPQRDPMNLVWTLIATVMAFAGAASINHYWERDLDALMDRTRNRPLPRGVIPPFHALILGLIGSVGGVTLLIFSVSKTVGILLLVTVVLYVFIYTPMKTRTPLNTLVGSIPGAMPPVIGWLASGAPVSWRMLIPFGIIFTWQQPHFYAIAWLYKEDYRRGGFKMWPVMDVSGKSTFLQIFVFTLLLIHLSLLPGLWGHQGLLYIMGSVILSAVALYFCLQFVLAPDKRTASQFIRMTVIYLPLLFLCMMLDKGLRS